MTTIGKHVRRRSASESDAPGRQRRPDFVVHLQLTGDNTTARLFAFRDVGGGSASSDDRRRTSPDRSAADLGLGLRFNASNHHVDLGSVQASSVTHDDYDGKGLQYRASRYVILARIASTGARCGLLLQTSHVACSVCVYVLTAATGSCGKTAEPIEMPFWE